MSIEKYLRLLVQGDKEMSITAVTVTDSAAEFEQQTTAFRKFLEVYNNSASGSGELYYGGSGVTPANGMVIPKGLAPQRIPLSSDVALYFVAVAGEVGDLRVIEIA